jgi:nicotinamide-nucleotide amidase
MKAIIITVGDEILIGQVIDTNSAWIGNVFNEKGIDIVEIVSVQDKLEAIESAIQQAMNKADLVVMTGGLGPTKDDITKVAIANYFGVEMVYSEETFERIKIIFEKFGRTVGESHKAQCFMPANAILLKNKMGTAPGMLIQHENKMLVSLPGVPYEMKSIITDELLPYLQKNHPSSSHIFHKTIMTSGEGETIIADIIEPLLENMPNYIKLAYLPSLGHVRVRFTGKHQDREILEKEVSHYGEIAMKALGKIVYGVDDISLEQSLQDLCSNLDLKLTTAESCTGGFISHKITSIPGSSSHFIGGIVSYSNDLKKNILNVNEETLIKHGAVSEQTVLEMLHGILAITKANVGIAISGIAGPDGGSEEKPVGTIWIAYGNDSNQVAVKINSTKDRLKNIEYASHVALNKLRLFILENYI